jgi:NAD(P)-dependent dehydrogenase (short-subunit alcohol dehydrogenase family)
MFELIKRCTLAALSGRQHKTVRFGGPLFTAAFLALTGVMWRRRAADLSGQVVLITGGSRGLGLLLAREFGRQDCRVAICARDEAELARAADDLAQRDIDALTVRYDVSDPAQIRAMTEAVTAHFGRIDILVNNAGVIQVGPYEVMATADFEEALDVMFWPLVYTTEAVLPQMKRRGYGRIVNITSIGGTVSIPHLLPYVAAKFAATGFSHGLRAELAGQGISVTTIIPGLMRTGSHLNAFFKGHQEAEFTWFSLGASLPFISMSAERAARQIVAATRRGQAERTLSLPAVLLARLQGLLPGMTADLLGLANRLLPPAEGAGRARARGMAVQARLEPPHNRLLNALTTLGRQAAARYNQYPGPLSASPTPEFSHEQRTP